MLAVTSAAVFSEQHGDRRKCPVPSASGETTRARTVHSFPDHHLLKLATRPSPLHQPPSLTLSRLFSSPPNLSVLLLQFVFPRQHFLPVFSPFFPPFCCLRHSWESKSLVRFPGDSDQHQVFPHASPANSQIPPRLLCPRAPVLRMRARAQMIVKGGVCTAGFDG